MRNRYAHLKNVFVFRNIFPKKIHFHFQHTMARSPQALDTVSIYSTTSAVSSCPDRHGFYGGFQFSDKPKEPVSRAQIVAREKKWLDMMNIWQEYMSKNYKKIRERCRKGIPQSVRPKAWFHLCGAHLLQKDNPNRYEELLKHPGNPQVIEEIRKDQHRQFPMHEMFLDEDKPGQKELFNVLKAYSILNPKVSLVSNRLTGNLNFNIFGLQVGYCQAQAPIAAFLLMHMPAEQAFWCFVAVCDRYDSPTDNRNVFC